VKTDGPPGLIKEGAEFPFILLAPQCPEGGWWSPEALVVLLDLVSEGHRVDQDRVYVAVLSMRSLGTWHVIATYRERFAALAPVCGPFVWFRPGTLDELPIWCFHGAMDSTVSIKKSVKVVRRIRECGGRVRFTVYPDADHDSWTRAYGDPELHEWLLEDK